jgi:hypothetical protein
MYLLNYRNGQLILLNAHNIIPGPIPRMNSDLENLVGNVPLLRSKPNMVPNIMCLGKIAY